MTKRSRPDLWGASLERAVPTWKLKAKTKTKSRLNLGERYSYIENK